MALIKLVIALWILIMCIGAAGAVVIFIIDVLRWHDREEYVEVTPSNLDDIEESEVTMNGIENGINAGQYNPPSLPGAWGES